MYSSALVLITHNTKITHTWHYLKNPQTHCVANNGQLCMN